MGTELLCAQPATFIIKSRPINSFLWFQKCFSILELIDGIFNERLLKIENVDKIKKTLKNVENVAGIKNVKTFFTSMVYCST